MGEIITGSAEEQAQKYANDQIGLRRATYPSIEDQLDMLWHAMNDDESKRLEPFYSTIKAVKDQFPLVKEQ
jgi:hypothetical protein